MPFKLHPMNTILGEWKIPIYIFCNLNTRKKNVFYMTYELFSLVEETFMMDLGYGLEDNTLHKN